MSSTALRQCLDRASHEKNVRLELMLDNVKELNGATAMKAADGVSEADEVRFGFAMSCAM